MKVLRIKLIPLLNMNRIKLSLTLINSTTLMSVILITFFKPQSFNPHKACLHSRHQPTENTLLSTFKEISEPTEEGRVKAVPSIAITLISPWVKCVSQCSGELTKNRKPTSQDLCFPWQSLGTVAQPH